MNRVNKASIVSTILLILLTFVATSPFILMLIGAFKPSIALTSFPIDLNPFRNNTILNLQNVIFKSDIFLWILNSFIISLSVAFITVFISLTAGYAFAKIKIRGSKILFFFVIATMMMPKQVLLIPNYLVAYKLSLQDRMIGVILTSVAPAFGIFLCRQMISTIPSELFDAAEIDGCSEIKVFSRVVFPLSLPSMGTVAILSFFTTFNDYLWQLIMISKINLKTLPIGVAMYAQKVKGNRGVQLALALIATIPLAVLFIAFQKFFIKESTSGAVKG